MRNLGYPEPLYEKVVKDIKPAGKSTIRVTRRWAVWILVRGVRRPFLLHIDELPESSTPVLLGQHFRCLLNIDLKLHGGSDVIVVNNKVEIKSEGPRTPVLDIICRQWDHSGEKAFAAITTDDEETPQITRIQQVLTVLVMLQLQVIPQISIYPVIYLMTNKGCDVRRWREDDRAKESRPEESRPHGYPGYSTMLAPGRQLLRGVPIATLEKEAHGMVRDTLCCGLYRTRPHPTSVGLTNVQLKNWAEIDTVFLKFRKSAHESLRFACIHMINLFSKFSYVYFINRVGGAPTRHNTIAALEHWRSNGSGLPHNILSDQGSELMGEEVHQWLRRHCINHHITAGNSTQSNGVVERRHLSLKDALMRLE